MTAATDFRPDFAPLPDEDLSSREGEPFTVVETLVGAAEDCDGNPYDMYRIRFNDGTTADAFPEEVRTDSWHTGSKAGMKYRPAEGQDTEG